jgi:hypothetical protein
MPSHRFVLAALTLCLPSASLTQLERRGPDQKTIEISATEKVRVAAEVGCNDQDRISKSLRDEAR